MAETKKYLDFAGLSHFWTKVKDYVDAADSNKVDKTITVNDQPLSSPVVLGGANITVGGDGDHKDKNVTGAIEALDAAIKAAATSGVVSFGGATGAILVDTEGTAGGSVKFTMTGKTLSGAVTGFGDLATKAELQSAKGELNAAIGKKADQSALDTAKQELNSAIALKADQSALDEANGKISALEREKAAKTEAVGSLKVSGSATPASANVKASVSITTVSVGGSDLATKTADVTIPAATDSACGVVTLGTIKNLAAAAATSAYKVKGSKPSLAEVLAVKSAVVGDVYNITAQFTLSGKPYPAGTNVVFVGHGEGEGTDDPKQEVQWDALGGTVDLSPYATISALETAKTNLTNSINEVDKKVTGLSGTVSGHTNDIANLKTTTGTHTNDIAGLKTTTGTHTTDIANLKTADGQLSVRIATLEAWKDAPLSSTDIDKIFNPAG